METVSRTTDLPEDDLVLRSLVKKRVTFSLKEPRFPFYFSDNLGFAHNLPKISPTGDFTMGTVSLKNKRIVKDTYTFDITLFDKPAVLWASPDCPGLKKLN